MRRVLPEAFLSLLVIAFAGACHDEVPTSTAVSTLEPRAKVAFSQWSAWSAPVKVGPPISISRVRDGNAILSPDGLSLYYDSDRSDLPGAQGAVDMWVSNRACTDALDTQCAWQTPRNLGPLLNTPYVEGGAVMSLDGHLLFFLSHKTRPDCPAEEFEPDPTRPCDADISVSWRPDPNDDLGWGPPVPLPHPVNTSDEDNMEAFVPVGEPGGGNLYFSRAPTGTASLDIYYVPLRVTSRGASPAPVVDVAGPIVALNEINQANALDAGVTVSADGRELFFSSSAERRGRGAIDIWTSTRRSPREPWGAPTNVAELNTARADLAPRLSRDGQTLLFTSNRDMANPACVAAGLPGACGWDVYMSTRTRLP